MGKDLDTFLKEADMPDIKTYWEWVVDRYSKIKAVSSLKNYWRTLRMHMFDKIGRAIPDDDNQDIRNVSTYSHRKAS